MHSLLTAKHCFAKSEEDLITGKKPHVHGLEALILLRWPYSQNRSKCSTQFPKYSLLPFL